MASIATIVEEETARLESEAATNQWPEDFQTVLFDYLQDIGYADMPATVPVKSVPAAPYLAQARAMPYASGDQRSDPNYLAQLKAHAKAGNELPPLIVRGDALLDGRHRLLALSGPTVQVIDLNDT